MRILVKGKEVLPTKGFSIDYVWENRLFSGREAYTLSIPFPLRGCPQNVAVFGQIRRPEVAKNIEPMDCEIITRHFSLRGSLSVVKVTESQVQCQFTEGSCAHAVIDPFSDVYVNELDLGTFPRFTPGSIAPSELWKTYDEGAEVVALPWINTKEQSQANNWAVLGPSGFEWHQDVKGLSWQPFLIVLAERICRQLGYTANFQAWKASPMRNLIVCNTLPAKYGISNASKVLPSWTVQEFFDKLEAFMGCEFDFDHHRKTVSMRFSEDAVKDIPAVRLDKVLDAHEVDVAKEDSSSDYVANRRYEYKKCSHPLQAFYSCDWLSDRYMWYEYATVEELIQNNKRREVITDQDIPMVFWGDLATEPNEDGPTVNWLLYAQDVDTHYAFRSIGTEVHGWTNPGDSSSQPRYAQTYVLQPVNVFGPSSADSAKSSETLDFVPACIMDTYVSMDSDKGPMLYLTPGDEVKEETTPEGEPYDIRQPEIADAIGKGQGSKEQEYYSEVYLAFWTGATLVSGKPPCPVIDSTTVSQDWTVHTHPGCCMRLDPSSRFSRIPKIDSSCKYKFSWISNTIPNPRAIFYIKGRRYVCEKITATFTEDGMSQLLKGEFYPAL